MTAARDDDFMALPGMEADSTDAHHGRERLSGDRAPTSVNAASNTAASTSPTASSKSALDALLDEYRARAKSEREKGTLFEELTRQFLLHDARFAHQFKEIYLWKKSERRTGDTGIDLVALPVSHITLAALHARNERLDAKMNSMKLNGQEAENIIVAPISTLPAKTDVGQTTGIQLGEHKHALYSFTRNRTYASILEEHSQGKEGLHEITALREVVSTCLKGKTN